MTHIHPHPAPSREETSGSEASPLLEIRSLRAAYDGHTVLHDVNLTVYANDFLGIIGPNGGGKTTLIKCILGLLRPVSGEIHFHSRRPSPFGEGPAAGSPSSADRPVTIGYLPQYNGIDRKFPLTVEEVVLSGLSSRRPLAGRIKESEREQARRVLAQMGMEGMEKRSIGSLSGGQLQRVLLGRAIVSDPELLVLDEPSTYLDRRSSAQLYQLLGELNRRVAIILVSHDIGTVLQQVKNIACVNETLHYHPATDVDSHWLEHHFGCPIELLGHGALPHRVLGEHE